ncbi:hypothetical protein FOA52_003658 [Chlamydomonas sp. UWO 241]|nr:hypothetical protein FOA52_003658 [Chlamydomonas sp. UWO 241]
MSWTGVCGGETALLDACKQGHGQEVRKLLAVEGESDVCQGGRALYIAARHGHNSIVQMLLHFPQHAPCPACAGGAAALIVACEFGHAAVVRLLEFPAAAPRGASSHGGCSQALVQAATSGQEAIVKMLLESPRHAPDAAVAGGNVSIMRLLKESKQSIAASSSAATEKKREKRARQKVAKAVQAAEAATGSSTELATAKGAAPASSEVGAERSATQAAARRAAGPDSAEPASRAAGGIYAVLGSSGAVEQVVAGRLSEVLAEMQEVQLQQDECTVCMDQPRSVTLLPCGHRVMCAACCAGVRAGNGTCPVCRQIIERTVTVTVTRGFQLSRLLFYQRHPPILQHI